MTKYAASLNAHRYPLMPAEWFDNNIMRCQFEAVKSIVGSPEENRSKNILDWGCGNGLWTQGLFPFSNITGVDNDAEVLGYARLNGHHNGVNYTVLHTDEQDQLINSNYDFAIAIALIELLDEISFNTIFSKIYDTLKPGGKLFCTFQNWRPLSVAYISWLKRGGYDAYVQGMGVKISKESISQVSRKLNKIGFTELHAGGINPYPERYWSKATSRFFVTKSRVLSSLYYTQYLLLEK